MYVCRICLDSSVERDMAELPHHIEDKTISFQEVVLFCLSIQVCKDSDCDTKLCTKCFDALLSFYEFKTVALKNNTYIQSLKNEPVDKIVEGIKTEEGFEEYEVLEFDELMHDNEEDNSMLYDTLDDEKVNISEAIQPKLEDPNIITGKTKRLPRSIEIKTENKKRSYKKRKSIFKNCEECGEKTKDLEEHLLSHRPGKTENELLCDKCHLVFANRKLMMKHKNLKHSLRVKYQCSKCDKLVLCLTRHARNLHKASLPPEQCGHCAAQPNLRRVRCHQCPKTFTTQNGLDKHIEQVHSKDNFVEESSLQSHIDDSETELVEETVETSAAEVITNSVSSKMFRCVKCNQSFKSKTSLARHRRRWHDPAGAAVMGKWQCDICHKYYAELTVHKQTMHNPTPLPYACAHCPRRWRKPTQLAAHELTHRVERPYKCDHCSAAFKTKNLITVHIQSIHVKVKNFMCQLCSKSFYKRYHLDRHLLVHTAERPYECTECGARFKTADALRLHGGLHAGLRPYCCELCARTFRNKALLASHMRSHSSEQPHQCRFCDARYKRKDYRRDHERKAHLSLFNHLEQKKTFDK